MILAGNGNESVGYTLDIKVHGKPQAPPRSLLKIQLLILSLPQKKNIQKNANCW